MSITDTKDLFFLVLTICIAVLTFLTAWLLWYMVSMLRSAHRVFQSLEEKLQIIEDILHSLRENVGHSSAALVMLTKTVARLVQFGMDKKKQRDARKTRTNTKGNKKGASGKAGSRDNATDDVSDFFGDANS